MTFEVGQRIRTTRINVADVPPVWHVGDTGTIVSLPSWLGDAANVRFDQFDGDDIVNFDEMEVIADEVD